MDWMKFESMTILSVRSSGGAHILQDRNKRAEL